MFSRFFKKKVVFFSTVVLLLASLLSVLGDIEIVANLRPEIHVIYDEPVRIYEFYLLNLNEDRDVPLSMISSEDNNMSFVFMPDDYLEEGTTYSFYVTAIDNAGHVGKEPKDFKIDLGNTTLELIQPQSSYVSSSNFYIVVKTNRESVCRGSTSTTNFEEMNVAFDPVSGTRYEYRVSYSSFSTTPIYVVCSNEIDTTDSLTLSFSVDTTSPQLSVDDTSALPGYPEYTNVDDSLRVKFTAEDPESGIEMVNYTIEKFDGTEIIGWRTTQTLDEFFFVSSLNLEDGTKYYFKAKARNNAGIWSLLKRSDGVTVDLSRENPCQDGVQNFQETDVDCGGDFCDPCEIGDACVENSDCNTRFCNQDTLLCEDTPEHCKDDEINEDETDVDCGGSCPPCEVGQQCNVGEDCILNYCDEQENICMDPSTFCSNGEQDHGETDVDCGGSCSGCAVGESCQVEDDCSLQYCDPESKICMDPSQFCYDGIQNHGETDVDCGGSCSPCSVGSSCESDDDCLSGFCNPNTKSCATSNCGDGFQNGFETDVDCGGSCSGCGLEENCEYTTDCAYPFLCDKNMHVCVMPPPTCTDNFQNGDETDVDCGGNCFRCGLYKSCQENSDCKSDFCNPVNNQCEIATCDDGFQNGYETDVDCGGSCDRCDTGNNCEKNSDCQTLICEQGTCVAPAPTCDDFQQNGDETGVDCGGSCAPCEEGGGCDDNQDCLSLICDSTTGECKAHSCEDGNKNGDETDVDCGGSCSGCEDGEVCEYDSDCISSVCEGGSCVGGTTEPESCSNGMKDDDESDVDCGGPCDKCSSGDACRNDADCLSNLCDPRNNFCTNPSCNDGWQNGDETDVDCGGSCNPCEVEQDCVYDSDCETWLCDPEQKMCKTPPASCTDGIQNGDETDVDCGGNCFRCGLSKQCDENDDCKSGFCNPVTGLCAFSSCDDGFQNGDETDVDCGGTCTRCAIDSSCEKNSDCLSLICDGNMCVSPEPTCYDGVQNGDETGLDCGGSCSSCELDESCKDDSDCQSELCDASSEVCTIPSCDDNYKNGDESDVDCGGSCDKCGLGKSCGSDFDCVTGNCDSTTDTCVGDVLFCEDGVLSGDESDVDCGGSCYPCELGEGCEKDSDCISSLCDPRNNFCTESSCDDSWQNGDESDVDCGGSCTPCEVEQDCVYDSDCETWLCDPEEKVCKTPPASCTDGIKNGDESDVDCGGNCFRCGITKSCVDNDDCKSDFCNPDTSTCELASCDDNYKNGFETDVDCGGSCPRCDTGDACEKNSDCETLICSQDSGACMVVPETCTDGIKNNDESDVDCGGSCPGCELDESCAEDQDCQSNLCDPQKSVCAQPSCDDNYKNGDESDVDCGGSCDKCGLEKRCNLDEDCLSGSCDPDIKICTGEIFFCEDGTISGDESDVDCGGSCLGCDLGMSCADDSDCKSQLCDFENFICAEESCQDGRHNNGETDIDCGGNCDPCELGESCEFDTDCKSSLCHSDDNVCILPPPTCTDGVQNGDESDVDCGGNCFRCGLGKTCGSNGDCKSDFCNPDNNKCEVASCDDDYQNGFETDVDCGGNCDRCDIGKSCEKNSDCQTLICDQGTSICIDPPATCKDDLKNEDETDIDCGGSCPACDVGKQCEEDEDCKSNLCDSENSICAEPSCDDGLKNGLETDIDCGGNCGKCANKNLCKDNDDCESGFCNPEDGRCAQNPASCSDKILNSDETDVDCGGGCDACELGKKCLENDDCKSLSCDTKTNLCIVRPETCDNDIRDGDETDVDCGGSCSKCNIDETCERNEDCKSSLCDSSTNKCIPIPSSCKNDVMDDDETDVDCGGSCPACEINENCRSDSDCKTNFCSAGECKNKDSEGGIPGEEEEEDRDGDETDDETDDESSSSSYDKDEDGMPDSWEQRNGLSDSKEIEKGTDPTDPDDKPGSPWLLIIILLVVLLILGGGGYYAYLRRDELAPYLDTWMTQFDGWLDNSGVRDFFRKMNMEIPHYTPGSLVQMLSSGDQGNSGNMDALSSGLNSPGLQSSPSQPSSMQSAQAQAGLAIKNALDNLNLGASKKDQGGQSLMKKHRKKESQKKREDIFSSFSEKFGSNLIGDAFSDKKSSQKNEEPKKDMQYPLKDSSGPAAYKGANSPAPKSTSPSSSGSGQNRPMAGDAKSPAASKSTASKTSSQSTVQKPVRPVASQGSKQNPGTSSSQQKRTGSNFVATGKPAGNDISGESDKEESSSRSPSEHSTEDFKKRLTKDFSSMEKVSKAGTGKKQESKKDDETSFEALAKKDEPKKDTSKKDTSKEDYKTKENKKD